MKVEAEQWMRRRMAQHGIKKKEEKGFSGMHVPWGSRSPPKKLFNINCRQVGDFSADSQPGRIFTRFG